MDLRSRVLANCFVDATNLESQVDFQSLIERLILFDTFILESGRLKEFSQFVSAFGHGPTIELLNSDLLEISCDGVFIVAPSFMTNQYGQQIRPHPFCTYSFGTGKIADHGALIAAGMKEIADITSLHYKQIAKLKSAISRKIIPRIESTGDKAISQLRHDIRSNNPFLKGTVATALSRKLGNKVDQGEVSLEVHEEKDNVFRVESNLSKKFKLSDEESHKTIEAGLLAAGSLEQALEYMELYSAVSTLRADESAFLDQKLLFLFRNLDPNLQVERLRRVVQIVDFPNLQRAITEKSVRLDRVIDIAKSDECRKFREWLRNTDNMSDAEIRDAFAGTRAKLATLASGLVGKTVRWLASTGIGAIPGAGAVLGPAEALVDTFLMDKVLPKPGPVSFLQTHYRSIFDR